MYCIIYLDDVIVFECSEEEHLECLRIVLECFREFNLKLKPSKCLFFQSEIVHHMHTIEEFPMPESFTQVCTFCGFTYITRLLYDILGKEVKMGPVQLPPEAQEVVRTLKGKIQSAPMLVFPDFDKPFLLEMNGLGAVLSQKQDDGHYHPIAFGNCSLTPM